MPMAKNTRRAGTPVRSETLLARMLATESRPTVKSTISGGRSSMVVVISTNISLGTRK
jgi:hypothetical protein